MSPSSASDHCYVSNCFHLHSHDYIKLILAMISLHGKSFMLKDATRIQLASARLTRAVTITTRIVTRRQRGTRLFVGKHHFRHRDVADPPLPNLLQCRQQRRKNSIKASFLVHHVCKRLILRVHTYTHGLPLQANNVQIPPLALLPPLVNA